MVKVRTAKSKGANMEYDCHASLKQLYPDIVLTKQIGFVQQYDLITDIGSAIFECKRHKGFSWNELEKLFLKLESRVAHGYTPYLLLQGNRQPPLVMYRVNDRHIIIKRFEDKFCPFIKHIGMKKNVSEKK